jgi:hypothetical protein
VFSSGCELSGVHATRTTDPSTDKYCSEHDNINPITVSRIIGDYCIVTRSWPGGEGLLAWLRYKCGLIIRCRQRGDDGFVWGENAVLQHLQGLGHAVKRPVEATLSLWISTQQTLYPHARQEPCLPQRETNCCATTNYYLTNRWRHHQRKHICIICKAV